MKWFNKWFAQKCKQAWEDSQEVESNMKVSVGLQTASPIRSNSIGANGMNFSVYKANGGFVIEYRLYDQHKDRNDNKLHIITEDQDLGEELGKIISFEALRS